ncbi:MAG: UDP-N-acetylmuramate dehydrogenase [Alphaproteobacteria bacterium]
MSAPSPLPTQLPPVEPLLCQLQNAASLRGVLEANAPLHRHTWFRVGGNADILFTPANETDLAAFLAILPAKVPLTILGIGSNVLIRDGGVRGVVIRLARGFTEITQDGDQVCAQAAVPGPRLARFAMKAELASLEFFFGIPGTVGGALTMNAGAFGSETKDVLVSASALMRDGTPKSLTSTNLEMSYRHSNVPDGAVFVSARYQASKGSKSEIQARLNEIKKQRDTAQPTGIATGGSTFKNPPNASAWKLIEDAQCRNLRVGAARVSEKHCNFLINEGGASASDIEALGEEIRRRVFSHSGIQLQWEIRRIGEEVQNV